MKSIIENYQKAIELVKEMTLEEKASLTLGSDFWHTKEISRLNLKSIQVSDGPHGLRKEVRDSDKKVLVNSYPATCFPLAAASSCSFDKDLLEELGDAIGKECLSEDIAVILGPGTNIKRSPLCGRNFEYFSEDPFLAGNLSASFIKGVQENNVGVSLKHFFANNQEKLRLVSDSIIDKRAIREIYLKPFEIAIKKSKPATIMSSYNKVNSMYVGENKEYLEDVLRNDFGFDGVIISDWAAINDRIASIVAGCDLEMPYSGPEHEVLIIESVKKGLLKEEDLDKIVVRIVSLILATMNNQRIYTDLEKHHCLARKIARESAVLLKNDNNILPLSKTEKVVIIGEFAEKSRYQGAGSSRINPSFMNNPLDELRKNNINFVYAKGYDSEQTAIDEEKIKEAKALASGNDKVVLFVGLPDSYESEGFDRKTIDMPDYINKLVDEVCEVNDNVIVVIYAGSVTTMPWKDKVKGILLMNLSGQNNGGAFYDVAFGDYSPSGRLSETYVEKLEDTPCFNYFAKDKNAEYRESIFVGYRYYERAKKKVAFPFGYGLSYSKFEYSNLTIDKEEISKNDELTVKVTVKNVGTVKAKEVVQLYIEMPNSKIYRPIRELKEFSKIELEPNEEKVVTFILNEESFDFYDSSANKWKVEEGSYLIEICSSAITKILTREIKINSSDKVIENLKDEFPSYYNLKNEILNIPLEEFEKLIGYKVPLETKVKPYTLNSPFRDLKKSFIGRIVYKKLCKLAPDLVGEIKGDLETFIDNTVGEMPLRGLAEASGGAFSITKAEGLVDLLNGKLIRGIRKLTK